MSQLKTEDGKLTEAGIAHVSALIAQLSDIEEIMATATFPDRPSGSLELKGTGKRFYDPSKAVRRGFAQAAVDTRRALAALGVTARETPWVAGWLTEPPEALTIEDLERAEARAYEKARNLLMDAGRMGGLASEMAPAVKRLLEERQAALDACNAQRLRAEAADEEIESLRGHIESLKGSKR